MIWESMGGLLKESANVLLSLCRAADERLGLRSEVSKDKFYDRISFLICNVIFIRHARNNAPTWRTLRSMLLAGVIGAELSLAR